MAKNTYVAILLCILFPILGHTFSGAVAHSIHGRGGQPLIRTDFQEVWQVYGDQQAFATLRSYEVEFMRLTWISQMGFIERHAYLSVNGKSFVRQLIDPQGTKVLYAILDKNGRFHEGVKTLAVNGDKLSHHLPTRDDRAQGVIFSVEICGLIPILKKCAQPDTKIEFLQRTPQMLDKFRVAAPDVEFMVYTDQSRLIRRVDIRRLTLQFADYRMVNGLKLPHTQHVLLANRLVYQFNFTKIELNPAFPADFFDGTNGTKWPRY